MAHLIAAMLQRDGYEVNDTESAAKAIQMIADGARPDALVTGFIFPGTDGVALAIGIRSTIPDLAVLIVTTGALPLPEDFARNGFLVLQKPFTTAAMRESVFALMGRLIAA